MKGVEGQKGVQKTETWRTVPIDKMRVTW